MTEEFYREHDIIVRFDVFVDGEEFTPERGFVDIYDPDGQYMKRGFVGISGSEVRYTLEGEQVTKVGTYIFVFQTNVEGLGEFPHVVKREVKELPVPTEEEAAVLQESHDL